jgi:hypothetical protein
MTMQHVTWRSSTDPNVEFFAWKFGGSRLVNLRMHWTPRGEDVWGPVDVEPMPEEFGGDLRAFCDWLHYVDPDTYRVASVR